MMPTATARRERTHGVPIGMIDDWQPTFYPRTEFQQVRLSPATIPGAAGGRISDDERTRMPNTTPLPGRAFQQMPALALSMNSRTTGSLRAPRRIRVRRLSELRFAACA